ncbi:hypothetical protein KUC3_21430 [Alteromonas sp. KC3]|uniref:hypothetical protein n=1 Tax=Alteromonas sp. KC3 TaxID=2795688 RepID=UPI00192135CB|nr:hypothetical protein [Alteromonas sp. KC3]BCO19286.1 hypothetical protein KUC3_21430 [Alteromonas sp. KC3]
MPMQRLLLLFILACSSYFTQADQVIYELGSYRDKSLLTYSESSLKLTTIKDGSESVLCSSVISEDTLAHSLEFFKEAGIISWEPTYFSESKMDGVVFKLSVEINNVSISSMGHLDSAPKKHWQLMRYFNQLLVVNSCSKSI